ncbi:hypothetical protein CK247_29480, partial [Klebsiella pneumoniae]
MALSQSLGDLSSPAPGRIWSRSLPKRPSLRRWILAQYRAAGIAPQAVDSGAIIITGESAKPAMPPGGDGALAVAGRFVVASAGPHLESVIA